MTREKGALELLRRSWRNGCCMSRAELLNREQETLYKWFYKITHWWFLWQDKNGKALSNSLMESWTRWCFLKMSICCAVGLEGNTRRITIAYVFRKISCVLIAVVCLCQQVKQPSPGQSTWLSLCPFNRPSQLIISIAREGVLSPAFTIETSKLKYAREHGWNLFHVSEIRNCPRKWEMRRSEGKNTSKTKKREGQQHSLA